MTNTVPSGIRVQVPLNATPVPLAVMLARHWDNQCLDTTACRQKMHGTAVVRKRRYLLAVPTSNHAGVQDNSALKGHETARYKHSEAHRHCLVQRLCAPRGGVYRRSISFGEYPC